MVKPAMSKHVIPFRGSFRHWKDISEASCLLTNQIEEDAIVRMRTVKIIPVFSDPVHFRGLSLLVFSPACSRIASSTGAIHISRNVTN